MKKLYEKSEITFAIVCIVIYVVTSSLADSVSFFGIPKSASLILDLVLSVVLLRFIRANKLEIYYGLCKSVLAPRNFLFYIPLAVLASVNIWFGIVFRAGAVETVVYILCMMLVGFLEEIIFRGLLFKATAKENLRSAILVSSITFGIGHIVNLLNGAAFVPTLCQIVYAVAIGFLFVTVFHRGKSLLSCIFTHGVFNALSIFSNEELAIPNLIPVSIAIVAICIVYAFYLYKKLPEAA